MTRYPGMVGMRPVGVLGFVLAAGLASCGDASDRSSADGSPGTEPVAAASGAGAGPTARCLVRLHGKGGDGTDTVVEDDVTVIAPEGNGEGWGGRQWSYFPDDRYEEAREVVAEAVAGCDQVIVHGFSNGGAFAAKLHCRGETFGGSLVGVVVDDPVVDSAVEGCAPDPTVSLALYWTGALDPPARPGWECEEADWTCEGGRTIGIEAYADALETDVQASPHDEHIWNLGAPELANWR